MTPWGTIVLRGGHSLMELEVTTEGVAAYRLNADVLPSSYAVDRDGALLTVTEQFLGQLDSTGGFSHAVPLPDPAMHLVGSVNSGRVYLFGGQSAPGRVYVFYRDGEASVLADIPSPIVSVADSGTSVYLATTSEIYRLAPSANPDLVIRLPRDVGAIRSIAVVPTNKLLFFSTDRKIYSLRGRHAVPILTDVGGALVFHDRQLYVWDPKRELLLRISGIEKALLGDRQ